MPALDLDWPAVQMLAQSIGIVGAAERMGLTDHLAALYQRSKREGWLSGLPRNQALPPTVLTPVSTVSTAQNALKNSMQDDAWQGRAAALRLGRKALVKLADKDVDELLLPEVADVALKYTKQHATAAGYGASDSVARVDLRITGAHEVSAEQPTVYEAEWSDAEQSAGAEPTVT